MNDYVAGQDPADFNAKAVVAYLENADLTADEFAAVQEWETQGKARATILRLEYSNGDETDDTEDYDLSGLQELSPEEMAKAPRLGRARKPNPLDPFMEKSYDQETAFSQTLDNERVKDFVSKVRRSATNHGWGSKVRLIDSGSGRVLKSDESAESGKTVVQFQATDKRERKSGDEQQATDQETAENTTYEYSE